MLKIVFTILFLSSYLGISQNGYFLELSHTIGVNESTFKPESFKSTYVDNFFVVKQKVSLYRGNNNEISFGKSFQKQGVDIYTTISYLRLHGDMNIYEFSGIFQEKLLFNFESFGLGLGLTKRFYFYDNRLSLGIGTAVSYSLLNPVKTVDSQDWVYYNLDNEIFGRYKYKGHYSYRNKLIVQCLADIMIKLNDRIALSLGVGVRSLHKIDYEVTTNKAAYWLKNGTLFKVVLEEITKPLKDQSSLNFIQFKLGCKYEF